MFDTPACPFTKRVVTPIPAIFFKEFHTIFQILCPAGRPGDNAELADVNLHTVLFLEFNYFTHGIAQLLLVPIDPLNKPGISPVQPILSHGLRSIVIRLIKVRRINQIIPFHYKGLDFEPGNDDGSLRINLTDQIDQFLCHFRPRVVGCIFRSRLVEQIISIDRRIAAKTGGKFPPCGLQ